jgi:diguanylate cyclase (GGDEF)-like protein
MTDPTADSFEDLFEDAPCGYLSADESGLITRVNRTLLGWIGAQREEVVGSRTVADLFAPRSRRHYTSHCVPLLEADGRVDEVILGLVVPGGDPIPVMMSAAVRPGGSGGPGQLLVTMLPAVERLDYERQLRDAKAREQRARERMEHLQEITQVLAATLVPGGIASVVLTESLAGTQGATGTVLLRDGDGWRVAAHLPADETAEPPGDQVRAALSAQAPVLSPDGRDWVAPLEADGRVHGVLWVRAAPGELLDGDDAAFLGTCAGQGGQALERARLFDVLSKLAGTDDLTGLPNRRAWDAVARRELAQMRRTGRPLCVAMVDLDEFKAYNDTHGHPAGDSLLRELASGWRVVVRDVDVLARYGGEEFALLLPGCGVPAGIGCIERLRRNMPRGTTCSVGLAQAAIGESLEDLLVRADAALYRAKRAGRNRIEMAPPPEEQPAA